MTRDKLIELLGWRLGDRKDMAERAVAEMDFVQTFTLEAHHWLPWFLEKEFSALQVLSGTAKVALPADFLAEIEDSPLYLVDSAGARTKLAKDSYDSLLQAYPGTGTPAGYCFTQSGLQLFPYPDQAYTLEGRYYGKDALMSAADAETLWLAHAGDLVMALLGVELAAKHLQDTALAAVFSADAQVAWERLLYKHTSREELNVSRAMGGRAA